MKHMFKLFVLCMVTISLSGCWDHEEINNRAIWIATGLDTAEDGKIEMSAQIVVPVGGGGEEMTSVSDQGFFTVSAKGRTAIEALQNIQEKLSRKVLFGHRKVLFFGEEFAKQGLQESLDNIVRTPLHSLRGDVFVVKGGTAKEIMNQNNPLENPPALAALKEHRNNGGRGDTAFLHFLISANQDGIRPSLPTINLIKTNESADNKSMGATNMYMMRLSGVSVFDQDLNMLGFLNDRENRDLLWILGLLKQMSISAIFKEGNASINLNKFNSNIEPQLHKDHKVSFTITLKGQGLLEENNSGLDMTKAENIKFLEQQFARVIETHVHQTVAKVQKEYKMDVFGLGEAIHRKHPKRWELLKNDWDQVFPEVDVTVKARIKIKQVGMNRPSLLFRRSENNK